MIFLTAFITGLISSFHCVGMCGPIALATPSIGDTLLKKSLSKLLYNIGRIITYAIMGFLLGSLGMSLNLIGLQQSISIIAGVVIILMVVFSSQRFSLISINPFLLVKGKAIANLFQSKKYSSLLLIGLFNGLLPCGFVYIALVGSIATQQAAQGALFMTLFGLGTLPMMFAVSMLGQFLSISLRNKIRKLTPLFAILIACLFILRGLNLGVPYVSPKLSQEQGIIEVCHQPK